ncbi:MAG: hypothetical protein M3083_21935 [Actinomycetota bacterium]|nr:hypothetical protein [Actinomycetota bacterium]
MSTAKPINAWAATRRALAEAMGQIDGLLPGSVIRRHMRCGKQGCACTADPPTLHGPYIQWTRTVNGKTVTRYLSEEQLARYQPWFDNSRHLKDIIAKLEIASLHAVEQSEREPTGPQNASPTAAKRRSPHHSSA